MVPATATVKYKNLCTKPMVTHVSHAKKPHSLRDKNMAKSIYSWSSCSSSASHNITKDGSRLQAVVVEAWVHSTPGMKKATAMLASTSMPLMNVLRESMDFQAALVPGFAVLELPL